MTEMYNLIQKGQLFNEKVKIPNSEKVVCQKVVAMVTSNLMDKHLISQIFCRYTFGKVTKFGDYSLLI